MNENSVTNTKKDLLMKLVRSINEAQRESIQILKTTPLCNTNVVAKVAKNLKDPNSISSNMIMINRKFPLQINRRNAENFRIPSQYLAGTKDHHNHNNMVCKKETVSWWAEHSSMPDEGQIKTIDLLYKKHRDETKEYFSVNWNNAVIKFGEMVMTKQVTTTQNPIANVPREFSRLYYQNMLFHKKI